MIHKCDKSPITDKSKRVCVEYKHRFWDFNCTGRIRWMVVTYIWSNLERRFNHDTETDVEKSSEDGEFHCPFCQEVLSVPKDD